MTNSAYAYLDPGSGSQILQMLVAGLIGGAYAIKIYWHRILNFFRGKSSTTDDSSEEVEND
ncbi:MAG: hypothetical protein H6607_10275 [Flavobacteriales bacterium]|nr:hypothetical protein [Flavobacteriales bacterium]